LLSAPDNSQLDKGTMMKRPLIPDWLALTLTMMAIVTLVAGTMLVSV
jgi:hypothetical protein